MKKRVLFFCGGISGEHEISVISCKHILRALNREEFEPILVLIQRDRQMQKLELSMLESVPDNPKLFKTLSGEPVDFRPYSLGSKKAGIVWNNQILEADVAFPVLHGDGGEDGSIQGFLQTAGIPSVGCSLTSSALSMDKSLAKKVCQMDGLPVVPFIELSSVEAIPYQEIEYPCFVKPAIGGSSLGVSRVESESDLQSAVHEALKWHTKVLIEPAIEGRELEIAILDDGTSFVVSPAGEIRYKPGSFYSYEAKYVDENSAELIAPAPLEKSELKQLQDIASGVFRSLGCKGMARVDFFRNLDGQFLFNEINTIPGFTPISMYPKLMQLAGIPYSELLSRLIRAAKA